MATYNFFYLHHYVIYFDGASNGRKFAGATTGAKAGSANAPGSPLVVLANHPPNLAAGKEDQLDDLNVNIDGSIVLDRDVRFFGSIAGTLTVPAGRTFELHGSIGRDLVVEKGAKAIVSGSVRGTLINKGADVLLRGSVGHIEDYDSARPTRRDGRS